MCLAMSERPHRTRTARKPFVGLAAVLFLILSLNSVPSVPSVPDPLEGIEIPSAEEVRALEELADWLLGERGLQAMSPRALTAAIRAQPRTFEIFRSYNPIEARRQYVVGLPYGEQIFAAARRHGLDSLLVASLVEAESSFVPHAVSPQGAVGLMQVMPATGRLLGPDGGALDLGDPTVNLEVGARYLRDLLIDYDGDLELALAAYNAGPAAVERFGGVPPYRETRTYLTRVLATYVEHHRRVWEESGADQLFEF